MSCMSEETILTAFDVGLCSFSGDNPRTPTRTISSKSVEFERSQLTSGE